VTVTVAAANHAPTVDAGANQSVTLPASASLEGTAADDGFPNPPGTVTTTWSQVSGPGTVTFGAASSLSTTASFSAAGPYVLRLTAGDSELSAFDEVTVTASGVPAPLPIAVAQALVDAAAPGSTVLLPQAIYATNVTGGGVGLTVAKAIVLDLNGSVLRGAGVGTSTSGNSRIVEIGGGATVRNGIVEQARNHGVVVAAATIEELLVRDCTETCVVVGTGAVVRYVEAHNSRLGTGFGTGAGTNDILIHRSIAHDNGRDPDGNIVGSGGNSDGSGTFKDCEDTADHCYRDKWVENIVYRNTDDGFDVSVRDAELRGNISWGNGPAGRKGYKMLRSGTASYYGNVAAGPQERGFEFRFLAGGQKIYQNLVLGQSNQAYYFSGSNSSAHDFRANVSTAALVVSPGFEPPLWRYEYPAPTVAQRWAFLYGAFRAAFTAAGPAVNAGQVIPGYHCLAAGPGDGTCVEWAGSAPDAGPFESGMGPSP
jgi:hypothetical protein